MSNKLFRPGLEVIRFRNPDLEHKYRNKSIAAMAEAARVCDATMMPYAQYSEQAILNAMFGNACAQVGTTIAAAATAQTSIVLRGTAGSGSADTTPGTGSSIWTGTPGSGATQNTYSAPHSFINSGGAPTGTAFGIASQSIGLAVTVGDFVFLGGGSASGGTTTAIPSWQLNTLYIGLTTQAVSGATQANVLSGEPTSTGSYARIVVLNNRTNMPLASAATPSVLTSGGPFSFPASSAGWSTGATNLIQMFISDAPTLAGGNVLAFGALGTPQAVNASGITLSFASSSITITLT
jgi:hypothetical protein